MVWTPRKSVWTRQPPRFVGLDPDIVGPSYQGVIARPFWGVGGPAVTNNGALCEPRLSGSMGFSLTGSSGYLTAPTIAGTGPWTLLAYGYVRSAGVGSIAATAEAPGDPTSDRSIYVSASDLLSGYLYDGSFLRTTTAPVSPTVGVPFLGAVTCDGANLLVYMDGEPGAAQVVLNAGYNSYTSPEFVIGYGNGGFPTLPSRFTAGYVLKIERAMSGPELRRLANKPWSIHHAGRRRVFAVSASGNNYNVSATEVATAADSLATAMFFAATRSETATAAEVIATALVIASTINEAATSSEASTTGSVSSNAATEAATATEAASALKQLAASLTETATAADLATALLIAVATVAEAASATQTASANPQVYADVTETAAAADALQAAANLVAQVTEAAAAGDAFTRAAQLVALITEPASAADSATGNVPTAYSVSLTELATAIDTLVATLISGGGPEVQAAISAARRARGGLSGIRPAQVSTARRPSS